MGLILNAELSNGILVNGAYFRIDRVAGSKEELSISVFSYFNKEAYSLGKDYIEIRNYSLVPSVEDGSENFIKQGYGYLKTLPEFLGAIDA